ncbi:DUF3515 family protein [Leucobacter denitrificans]|uniref:DUF3515 family protein n=2 Tax=Leucobacter denitrificans TaxID=683042 RepID=A0A7G9S7J2_9MICO|nr:DUF3515 family protein [Leucobacter denitrificans]
MDPAVDANDPACANVIVRLPATLDGLDKRNTNAQATGAWGDPASVLLYCGIEPSGPTTDHCVTVGGIDWIVDESRAPLYRFEAYGRTPGLEVIVNADEQVSGTNVISELRGAVEQLPQERHCVSVSEVIDESQFGDAPNEQAALEGLAEEEAAE